MISDVSQHFEQLKENKQRHFLLFSLAISSSIIARHGCREEFSHLNIQLIRIGPMMKKGTAKPIIVQILAIAWSSIPRVPMEPFRRLCLCWTFTAEILKQKVDFNDFVVWNHQNLSTQTKFINIQSKYCNVTTEVLKKVVCRYWKYSFLVLHNNKCWYSFTKLLALQTNSKYLNS